MTNEELIKVVEKRMENGFYNRRDRYFAIEPDGEVAYAGFQQKPAALRSVKNNGRGLVDVRDMVIVQRPDAAKRVERLSDDLGVARRNVAELEERIERYDKVDRTGQPEG